MQGKGYYKFSKVDHHVQANLSLFVHYFSSFIGLCSVHFLCQPFLFPLITSLWADNGSHLTQPSTLGANVGGSTITIYPLTSSDNTNRDRIIACSKKMKGCGALCCSTWHPWSLVPGTFGMHPTEKKPPVYQQGLLGAKFKSWGHMECIRPKKLILVYQQGLQGAKFRSRGHMECISPGTKQQYPCNLNI